MSGGQRALLRLTAASLNQAVEALSTVELALSEAPSSPEPAPALALIESVLSAWDGSFRQRGLALRREFARTLPDAPHEPEALRLALHHILRNALEALTKGGALSVRAGASNDGALKLEFVDDGPGFPAAWLERRFEAFAAPRRGHAGLGLCAARRALKRWGGDAEAANGPGGRGARLTLLFAPARVDAPPFRRE
jgi:signal transduction histidine kinase